MSRLPPVLSAMWPVSQPPANLSAPLVGTRLFVSVITPFLTAPLAFDRLLLLIPCPMRSKLVGSIDLLVELAIAPMTSVSMLLPDVLFPAASLSMSHPLFRPRLHM